MKSVKKSRAIKRSTIKKRFTNSNTLGNEYNNRALDRMMELNNIFYAGIDPRRRQEMADGGMVMEDPEAMANLSPNFIHKEYPRVPFFGNPYLDTSVEEE